MVFLPPINLVGVFGTNSPECQATMGRPGVVASDDSHLSNKVSQQRNECSGVEQSERQAPGRKERQANHTLLAEEIPVQVTRLSVFKGQKCGD